MAPKTKVLLVSDNELLLLWCRSELKNRCDVLTASEKNYLLELKKCSEIESVIVDFEGLEDVVLFSMYNYLHDMKKYKIIFVSAKNMNTPSAASRQKSFPSAMFCALYGSSNVLSQLVLEDLSEDFIEHPLIPIADGLGDVQGDVQELEVCSSDVSVDFDRQIDMAASSSACVLLLGESGSGKTWTARQIHARSSRASKKMVEVNLASLSPNLIESFLFGTVRGAFTGAVDSAGCLAEGNGSTIYFDEFTEIPPHIQVKLLKVIEDFSYRRVGSLKEEKFDARFIFATNAPIASYVEENKFRKDLLYRINTLTLNVPPLRKHIEDLERLVAEFAGEMKDEISPEAFQVLKHYSWPGNIRELKNVIYRLNLYSGGKNITADDVSRILKSSVTGNFFK